LLFDVISTAYERTSVIVTTNLPFEQWTEVLGSARLTGKKTAETPAKPREKD
jgi:DNA replication protein DnaC